MVLQVLTEFILMFFHMQFSRKEYQKMKTWKGWHTKSSLNGRNLGDGC